MAQVGFGLILSSAAWQTIKTALLGIGPEASGVELASNSGVQVQSIESLKLWCLQFSVSEVKRCCLVRSLLVRQNQVFLSVPTSDLLPFVGRTLSGSFS